MEYTTQIGYLEPVGRRPQYLRGDIGRTIIAVLTGEIQIYSYEGRKSKNQPKLEKIFRVLGEVRKMQLAKDSLLTVFFDEAVHAYVIDGPNSRQSSRKEYRVEKGMSLFQLAQCIDNVMNVFFWCPKKEGDKFFELWCMPLEMLPEKMIVG